MIKPTHQIFINSPNSLLLSFEFEDLNRQSILYLQQIKQKLLDRFGSVINYITPAFDTILINFKTSNLNLIKIQTEELLMDKTVNSQSKKSFNTYEIPVCYETFGKDLESISNHCDLKVDEIIEIHFNQVYSIFFIGFIPGFLYMGNADKRIQMPRLKKPRSKVEKGSVGIAENQTGIYPNDSPGGWQIVGRTPIDIFNVKKNPPSLFQPGDQVKFKLINEETFYNLKHQSNQKINIL